MKHILVLVIAMSILACACLRAQTLESGVRWTENNHSVLIFRKTNYLYGITHTYGIGITNYKGVHILDAEAQSLIDFPEATLLLSSYQYIYERNCHDYAWGPWMSLPSETSLGPGVQVQAWWMNNPSENWLDGSMTNVVTSYMKGWGPADGVVSGITDYLFDTSDLDWLPEMYYTWPFAEFVGLPTCPLDDFAQNPSHTAVLTDWFSPEETQGTMYAGIYQSKWGEQGIFQHRWGWGYCPPDYCNTASLRIFAPNYAWEENQDASYYVVYSPW